MREIEVALETAFRAGLYNGFWFGIAVGFVITSSALFFIKVLM